MAGMEDDPKSPTTLVLNYLSSKGLSPSAMNVSRALEMNANNPGTIPGLINQAPPKPDNEESTNKSTVGDHAPSRAPTKSSGIQKSLAKEVEGGNFDNTNQPAASSNPRMDSSNDWLGAAIATALGLGGGALAYGMRGKGGAPSAPGAGGAPLEGDIEPPGPRASAAPKGSAPPTIDGQVIAPDLPQLEPPLGKLPAPTTSGPSLSPQALEGAGLSPAIEAPAPQAAVAGPQTVAALPAPQAASAIRLPDATSGPTIPQGFDADPARFGLRVSETASKDAILKSIMNVLKHR